MNDVCTGTITCAGLGAWGAHLASQAGSTGGDYRNLDAICAWSAGTLPQLAR